MELSTSPPESSATIVDIRFSPEGNLLACASTDGTIYVFTLQAAAGDGDGAPAAGGWALKGAHALNYSLGTADEGRVPQPYKMDFTSDGNSFLILYSAVVLFSTIYRPVSPGKLPVPGRIFPHRRSRGWPLRSRPDLPSGQNNQLRQSACHAGHAA